MQPLRNIISKQSPSPLQQWRMRNQTDSNNANGCSYRYRIIIIWLVVIAVVGSNNLRRIKILKNLDEPTVVASVVSTTISHHSNHTVNVGTIDLLSTNNNATLLKKSSTTNDIFDCNHNGSKCRYFHPGEFYRHYFINNIAKQRNISNSSSSARHDNDDNEARNASSSSSSSSSDDQQLLIEWRKRIGLENKNLPALDSLSWWMEGATVVTGDDVDDDDDDDDDAPSTTISSTTERTSEMTHSLSWMMQTRINIQLSQNITYIHVHKCGGTSIQSALYKRARQIRKSSIPITNFDDADTDTTATDQQQQQLQPSLQAHVHTYKHSHGGGTKEKKRIWDGERLDHIRAIAEKQSSSSSSGSSSSTSRDHNHVTFPIFTVIRDPIQRFLSAIQQVMHYNTDFRAKCLHEPPQSSSWPVFLFSEKKKEERELQCRIQTIQCSIQDMVETEYRRDVHLIPMASHFRLLDYGYVNYTTTTNTTLTAVAPDDDDRGSDRTGNIAVSVFSMENIKYVLSYLRNGQEKGGQNLTNDGRTSKTTIHARDRSNVEYATSPILAKLSSEDCDDDMIRRICSLYDVDVELMKWLGFGGEAVERC